MRTGTARVYIYAASQIDDGIITVAKLEAPLAQSKARVYRSGSVQAIGAGAWTKVQFNAEQFDVGGQYDPAANYRFTVAAGYGGYYRVHAAVVTAVIAAAGVYQIAVYKGGVSVAQKSVQVAAGVGAAHPDVTTYVAMAEGEYLEIFVYFQAAASVLDSQVASYAEYIRIF